MKYAAISYEGLDSQGTPTMREARLIGELPDPVLRLQACAEATAAIGRRLGLKAVRTIPYGAPVYKAFGLKRPNATRHPESALLLTLGCNVALSLIS